MLFGETLGNPGLDILDIPRVAELAHGRAVDSNVLGQNEYARQVLDPGDQGEKIDDLLPFDPESFVASLLD